MLRCPKCGTEGEHRFAPPRVRSTTEDVMHHLGGWIMTSLWQKSREQRFLCSSCDEFFYACTEGSRVARAAFILLCLLIAYAIYDWLARF